MSGPAVPQMHIFDTPEAAGQALARLTAEQSAAAVARRGWFNVALSGGSMPRLLFPPLVSPPYVQQVDWSRWRLFWADERYTPLHHADSNFRLAREYLLSQVRIPAEQVFPIDDSFDLDVTARLYHDLLVQVLEAPPGQPPRFDMVLLGMGEDGHTASLFPGHPLLQESTRWAAFLTDSPKPPPERVTLTLPVLNHARCVAFLATGAGKADTLARVLHPSKPDTTLPAALVRPADGELHWFIDRAAAAKLDSIPD
ncbi:MAG: 6-phosphogluconolactonase [Chloroflexi bacterium]|nr:MAG: 6-phosphogluconolactonase [Chloroflexota bacterium]